MPHEDNLKLRRPRNPWTPEKIFKLIITTIRNYNDGAGCTVSELYSYIRSTHQDISLDDKQFMSLVKLSVKKGITLDFLRRSNSNGKYYIANLSSGNCKRKVPTCSPKATDKLQLQSSCQQSKLQPYPMPKKPQPQIKHSAPRESENAIKYRQAKTTPNWRSVPDLTPQLPVPRAQKNIMKTTPTTAQMFKDGGLPCETRQALSPSRITRPVTEKATIKNSPRNIKVKETSKITKKIVGVRNKLKVANKSTSTTSSARSLVPQFRSKATSTDMSLLKAKVVECLKTSGLKNRTMYCNDDESTIDYSPMSKKSEGVSDSLSRGTSISSSRESPRWFMHRKNLQVLSVESSERVVSEFKEHLKKSLKF